MKSRNILSKRVNKLLEFKNKSYKKKFYLLSRLSESNIKNDQKLFEEFKCLVRTLNNSNGQFPEENYIYEFISKNIVKSRLREIKESVKLNFSGELVTFDELISEELSKVSYKNLKLDKKLESTLIEAVQKKQNIFEVNSKDKVIDLSHLFSDVSVPSEELSQLSSEEDDDFSFEEESQESSQTASKIDKTVKRIIDIFGPITGGKDPKSVSKESLATMLGFSGNGKYTPGQKTPVLKGWDVLELKMMNQMSPYGRSKGFSTLAQRKWWIIETIKFCLMLEKQARFFLGLSDEEKYRLRTNSITPEQKIEVGKVVADQRHSGDVLPDWEIRDITNAVQGVLQKGEFNLEDSRISENELMNLLRRASKNSNASFRSFQETLDFMYPLRDTRAEFDKAPKLSDEDVKATQDEVESYFKKLDDETMSAYGDEIDPETGEPLYADEDMIKQINKAKSDDVIVKKDIIDDIVKSRYLNFTVREIKDYWKKLSEDLVRLGELEDKQSNRVNPEIFKPFEKDAQGNIIPDISSIPDIIPAEELTEDEKKELEEIIERLAVKDVITMINDSEREEIYQDLVDKSVSVDEFIAFNKRFNLSNADKPMSWEDIKRSSYGEFTGSAGARQYGVKAWMRTVFLNFSPSDKADIYANLAEIWYERLVKLDLIDDQAFAIKQDKVNPNDPSLDKMIPRSVLDAAEQAGKYKRSQKLVNISDMFELVNKYTQPKYIKRYFDEKRDDNLPQAVREKLHQIEVFAETSEEYDALVKRLEQEDPDTMAFAIMESMFNDNSAFRIFSTGLLKEYYNTVIWPGTEVALAQAVKDYFNKNYPSAGIAKSLPSDGGAGDVKPNEGKDLFNKIIYVAMERTGIKTSGKGMPKVGDSVEERKEYLRGNLDSRGDFVKAVAAYNMKYQGGKNPIDGKYSSVFSKDDVEDLIDDIFSPSGIIGSASLKAKKLDKTTASEVISWILSYPEAKLDQAIVLGLGLSDFYRREDVDPMLTLPIEKIGKDSAKALEDYKKKYGKQLIGNDFVEWLDDYLGIGPIDLKSKGSKNPGGKSFQ